MNYSFTDYFEKIVLVKCPYLTKEMCIRSIENPLRIEIQDDGERVRFWGMIREMDGRIIRVITLIDQRTIHNAFPDRNFVS